MLGHSPSRPSPIIYPQVPVQHSPLRSGSAQSHKSPWHVRPWSAVVPTRGTGSPRHHANTPKKRVQLAGLLDTPPRPGSYDRTRALFAGGEDAATAQTTRVEMKDYSLGPELSEGHTWPIGSSTAAAELTLKDCSSSSSPDWTDDEVYIAGSSTASVPNPKIEAAYTHAESVKGRMMAKEVRKLKDTHGSNYGNTLLQEPEQPVTRPFSSPIRRSRFTSNRVAVASSSVASGHCTPRPGKGVDTRARGSVSKTASAGAYTEPGENRQLRSGYGRGDRTPQSMHAMESDGIKRLSPHVELRRGSARHDRKGRGDVDRLGDVR